MSLRTCVLASRTILSGCRLVNLTSPCLLVSTNAPLQNTPVLVDSFASQKFKQLMEWYEEFTGLKDVRIAQEKVLNAQEHLSTVRDTRRDLNKQLSVVRERLKEIYSDLDQTSRGEDRYVLLITQEHKVLKEERKLLEHFNQCEQEEREHFSILSSAVKESHEKERIQAERTKYWSILGSVIGTVLGVLGSSINNEFKMRELRKLVQESSEHGSMFPHLREISSVSKDMKNIVQKVLEETIDQNVLNKIENQNNVIQSHILQLEKKIYDTSSLYFNGTNVTVDQLLDAQRKENRILILVVMAAAASYIAMSLLRS